MINRNLSILVLFTLIIVKNITGLSFILACILWILSLLSLADSIFDKDVDYNSIVNISLKTIYLGLTFLILSVFEYKSKGMLIILFVYVTLLIFDIAILKYSIKFKNDKGQAKKDYLEAEQKINIQYGHFITGKKDALFGKDKTQQNIQSLAYVTYSVIATIIFIPISKILSKIYEDSQSAIIIIAIAIMSVVLFYLYSNLIRYIKLNRFNKTIILTFALLTPIFFFIPAIISKTSAFKLDIAIYLNAIGIGLGSFLLYVCIKISQKLNHELSKKQEICL